MNENGKKSNELKSIDDPSLEEDLKDSLLVREASTPDSVHLLGVGTVVAGRYTILGLLGQGGMGTVYRAYDLELNRPIALKRWIAGDHAEKESDVQKRHSDRIFREAQAMAQLSHPNVVAVYDVGRHEDNVFIAMELVEGITLGSWIKQKKPTKKQTIEVMMEAGRGLAAAHRAGIIHLDFKPSNAIIGEDGRVKVIDFGLARAADASRGQDLSEATITTDKIKDFLYSAAHQTETLGGTPTYMAPEQVVGEGVGARADQFSFCVVLYEALYGKRPYSEGTIEELADDSVEQEKRNRRLFDTKALPRVRRILTRGLSADPVDRYPSMDDLLDEIQKDPAKKRKMALLTIGLLLAIGFGIFGASSTIQYSQQLCAGAKEKIEPVWNDERKGDIKTAFLATGKVYAGDTYQTVQRSLDDYVTSWVEIHKDACEATRVRGEQSEELLDLRMLCLSNKLSEFRALVNSFSSADDQILAKAVQASLKVTDDVRDCANIALLSRQMRPPKDQKTRTAVGQIHRKLAEARALERIARYKKSMDLATDALDAAKKINYRPIEAETLQLIGRIQSSMENYKAAEESLKHAWLVAEACGYDKIKAQALTHLVGVVGHRQSRIDDGLEFGLLAQSVVERLGNDKELQARLDVRMGTMLHLAGEYSKSVDTYGRAINTLKQLSGPQNPEILSALRHTANALKRLGKFDHALEILDDVLKKQRETLGSEHPDVAKTMENIGTLIARTGQYEEARDRFLTSLKIYRRVLARGDPSIARIYLHLGAVSSRLAEYDKSIRFLKMAVKLYSERLGPEHHEIAVALYNLGLSQLEAGYFDQALESCRRSLNIRKRLYGQEHTKVAYSYLCLGDVQKAKNQIETAFSSYKKSYSIWSKVYDKDHWLVGTGLMKIGDIWVLKGQVERALVFHQRAQAIFEKQFGPEHEFVAEAVTAVGEDFNLMRNAPGAIGFFERARTLCRKIKCQPSIEARADFGLAKAMWAGGRRAARVVELARKARNTYRNLPAEKRNLASVELWLKRRSKTEKQ